MSPRRSGRAFTPPRWLFPSVLGCALAGFTVWAWPARDALEAHVREGNAAFHRREFAQALERYEASPGDGPRNAGVHMNRGLARYRIALAPTDGGALREFAMDAATPEDYDRTQDEIRSTSRGFAGAPMEDIETALRARAAYNLGNTYFSEHSWQNAIDAYKESLRLSPGWIDAAWNLELARRRKEEQDRPDASPDVPDAPRDAAQDSPRDAPQDTPQDTPQDAPQDASRDSGQQGDSGEQGDSGQQGDSGAEGDSGADGGGSSDASSPPPQGDGGARPPPPTSLAPLDQLERNGQDLQQLILRRRAAQMPRNPDDER